MLNPGTYMILDKRSQQVGNASNIPPLEINQGERLSYRRTFTLNEKKDIPNEIHMHKPGYEVVVTTNELFSTAILYTVYIVGTDVKSIVDMALVYDHIFGVVELKTYEVMELLGLGKVVMNVKLRMSEDDRALLNRQEFQRINLDFFPSFSTMRERLKYFFKWLFKGSFINEKEGETQAGVTFVTVDRLSDEAMNKERQQPVQPKQNTKKHTRHPKPKKNHK